MWNHWSEPYTTETSLRRPTNSMRIVSGRKFYIVKMSKLRNTSFWTCDAVMGGVLYIHNINTLAVENILLNCSIMHTFVSLLLRFVQKEKRRGWLCVFSFVFVMMNRVSARHAIALQRECTAIHIENCATAKICINIQPVPVDAMKSSFKTTIWHYIMVWCWARIPCASTPIRCGLPLSQQTRVVTCDGIYRACSIGISW